MRLLASAGLAAGLGSLIAVVTPTPAHACGGTFCDAGPQVMDPEAMPVDQTGETIVFAIDETHVEAHIQINYDPDSGAERFAWLIPILGTNPEFSVSSQQLFTNLQNSTVPSYGYINNQEFCGGGGDTFGGDGWGGWDECDGTGDGAADGGSTGGPGGTGDDGATSGGGTQVVGQDTVGAFDIVLLQSETAQDLMMWLVDNEFYQDPLAEPILQEYVDEGALFAAIRLTNQAEVGEIHPLAMRYEGSEPCVPIRLTRIAAEDHMDIRAFFLGDARFFPSNYRHVELNPLKIDWIDLASNYKEVVTLAVDTPLVDGHGFVTEFAGNSAIIPRDDIYSSLWDHEAFQSADLLVVPEILQAQGLLNCEMDTCEGTHPLIMGILNAYIPVPEGVEAGEFYACLECFEGLIDLSAWNEDDFARDLLDRIIDPGLHAELLLDTHTYVTRLYTTISPHEMTEDPMFHADPELTAVVDNTAVTGTRYFSCGGQVEMQGLPGGRRVELANFDMWPDIAPDDMPWVERVTEMMPGVAPVELINNVALIDELLDAWNAGRSGTSFSCHDSDGGQSGGGGADGGTSDTAGQDGGEDGVPSGCGCRSDERGAGAGWALMALALGMGSWTRRRRRRRS